MPGSSPQGDGYGAPTSAGEAATEAQPGGSTESLAALRGSNWALPDATADAVAVTRPVRIECYAGRLAIGTSESAAGAKVVPLAATVEASVDPMVSALWDYMSGWGIAGTWCWRWTTCSGWTRTP